MATPSWTDNVRLASPLNVDYILSKGSSVRGTIDLRGKFGAFLNIAIGRGGTNSITNGVDVKIRRWNNAGTPPAANPAPIASFLSSIAAAASTTCATSNSASGQSTLNVASVTGFAAGDIICIQDSGGGVTRLEWQRVSKTAAGVLTLDGLLDYTHTTGQADTVRNKADVWEQWVDGGSVIEVIFDYGDDASGDPVTVRCLAQTFDSIS